MTLKPMLDDWEIPRIATIRSDERRNIAAFQVPGRQGAVLQDLALGPVRVVIEGSLFGDEARDEFLTALREKLKAGEPVTFVADIVTATDLQYVVIEALELHESGVHPDQIDYRVVLRESPPPPPPPAPGGLDLGLLDQAGDFLDSVSGALDSLVALGNLPDFADPTRPLTGMLDQVGSAVSGLPDALGGLRDLFRSEG